MVLVNTIIFGWDMLSRLRALQWRFSSCCFWDNLAKDVQSHFIRGPWLKQHNFHSKTYASNSKHHIYDRNMCPKHRDVNWMVYNRVIRFEMSPPEPFEICYFG